LIWNTVTFPFTDMLFNLLYLLAAVAPFAFADVKFTTPAAGAPVPAGGTFAVEWTDSGSAPSIADLASYQLFLCAGGNDASSFVRLPFVSLKIGRMSSLVTTIRGATDRNVLPVDPISANHDTRSVHYWQQGIRDDTNNDRS